MHPSRMTGLDESYARVADMSSDLPPDLPELGDLPAVAVINEVAVHLMTAAAVKVGLAEAEAEKQWKDLDEARRLITALAGLVTAAAPEIGSMHAAPLRDGLKVLQLAFREASLIPDQPGQGPGEKFTGPVLP